MAEPWKAIRKMRLPRFSGPPTVGKSSRMSLWIYRSIRSPPAASRNGSSWRFRLLSRRIPGSRPSRFCRASHRWCITFALISRSINPRQNTTCMSGWKCREMMTESARIGFTVAKVPPAKRFVPQDGEDGQSAPIVRRHAIRELAIPPYERNYLGPAAEITFLKDVELVWFRPHAHMRATSVQYKLAYPDGREEIVLNVPRYDFNWQLTYRTSLKIPKGSRMHVEFLYDNSANNRYNPDPSKWVYYGDQSWEEMGTPNMGFLMDRGAGEDFKSQP